MLLDKTPTTPDDQSVGVMNGLAQVAEANGMSLDDFCAACDVVVHGTTTADNTMIEMDGAVTGLLVTEGHRDEIEMRRVHKEQIWDPSYPAPTPIARRRARIAVPERLDHEGNVLMPLDEDAVRAGVRRLKALGVESIAVMFLFSYVNPAHERRARETDRGGVPRGRQHLAVPRGDAPGPGVRADVHHAGQRLRRPQDRRLRGTASKDGCASRATAGRCC